MTPEDIVHHTRTKTAFAATVVAALALSACSSSPEPADLAAAPVSVNAAVQPVDLSADEADAGPDTPSIGAPDLDGAAAEAVATYTAFLDAANNDEGLDALKQHADDPAAQGVEDLLTPMDADGNVLGRSTVTSSILDVELLEEEDAVIRDCLTVTDYEGNGVTQLYTIPLINDDDGWTVGSFGFPGDYTPCVPNDVHDEFGPVGTGLMGTFVTAMHSGDLTPLADLVEGQAARQLANIASVVHSAGYRYADGNYRFDAVPISWDPNVRLADYVLCAESPDGDMVMEPLPTRTDLEPDLLTEDGAPLGMFVRIVQNDGAAPQVVEAYDVADTELSDVAADTCFTGDRHQVAFPAADLTDGA